MNAGCGVDAVLGADAGRRGLRSPGHFRGEEEKAAGLHTVGQY